MSVDDLFYSLTNIITIEIVLEAFSLFENATIISNGISRFMAAGPQFLSATKGIKKLNLVKIFGLKQKQSNTSSCYRKNQVLSLVNVEVSNHAFR